MRCELSLSNCPNNKSYKLSDDKQHCLCNDNNSFAQVGDTTTMHIGLNVPTRALTCQEDQYYNTVLLECRDKVLSDCTEYPNARVLTPGVCTCAEGYIGSPYSGCQKPCGVWDVSKSLEENAQARFIGQGDSACTCGDATPTTSGTAYQIVTHTKNQQQYCTRACPPSQEWKDQGGDNGYYDCMCVDENKRRSNLIASLCIPKCPQLFAPVVSPNNDKDECECIGHSYTAFGRTYCLTKCPPHASYQPDRVDPQCDCDQDGWVDSRSILYPDFEEKRSIYNEQSLLYPQVCWPKRNNAFMQHDTSRQDGSCICKDGYDTVINSRTGRTQCRERCDDDSFTHDLFALHLQTCICPVGFERIANPQDPTKTTCLPKCSDLKGMVRDAEDVTKCVCKYRKDASIAQSDWVYIKQHFDEGSGTLQSCHFAAPPRDLTSLKDRLHELSESFFAKCQNGGVLRYYSLTKRLHHDNASSAGDDQMAFADEGDFEDYNWFLPICLCPSAFSGLRCEFAVDCLDKTNQNKAKGDKLNFCDYSRGFVVDMESTTNWEDHCTSELKCKCRRGFVETDQGCQCSKLLRANCSPVDTHPVTYSFGRCLVLNKFLEAAELDAPHQDTSSPYQPNCGDLTYRHTPRQCICRHGFTGAQCQHEAVYLTLKLQKSLDLDVFFTSTSVRYEWTKQLGLLLQLQHQTAYLEILAKINAHAEETQNQDAPPLQLTEDEQMILRQHINVQIYFYNHETQEVTYEVWFSDTRQLFAATKQEHAHILDQFRLFLTQQRGDEEEKAGHMRILHSAVRQALLLLNMIKIMMMRLPNNSMTHPPTPLKSKTRTTMP